MADYRFEVQVTIAEAIKIINREDRVKGRAFFLRVNQDAPIEGKPDYYFPVVGNVEVSKRAAIKFIQDQYKYFEDRGARVSICALDKCIFIG